MMVELTPDLLLATSGIALAVAVALQLLIKPWLTKQYAEMGWHDIALNGFALFFGVLFALVGLLIFGELSVKNGAWAAVQGLFAAFLAVYGYEAYKNLNSFIGRGK